MDLLKEVLETTKDFEAPRRYYYWSMLASVSAVLKDKVWFNMGDNYLTYPNIYVLLYGPSGIRKGPPIALAEELVSKVDNTRVIDGRSSIQAVIKELGTFITRPGGKEPLKDSCAFMVASELSSSIIGDNAAMDIMTNLYDRQYNEKEWKYRLKVGESTKLTKPTITWLAGTNEALFRDFMPEKNLHGGLIGRMFVITETRKHRTNSLMFKTIAPDKEKLAAGLFQLTKMKGEFEMSTETRKELDEWYNAFDQQSQQLNDDTGFTSRTLDFVVKVAMLIASARRAEQKILLEDVLESIQNILPLISPIKGVVSSVKKEDKTAVRKRMVILRYLLKKEGHAEERAKMLRNLGLEISHEDLDIIAQDFIQRNILTIDIQGGRTILRLRVDRPEVAEWLKEHKT